MQAGRKLVQESLDGGIVRPITSEWGAPGCTSFVGAQAQRWLEVTYLTSSKLLINQSGSSGGFALLLQGGFSADHHLRKCPNRCLGRENFPKKKVASSRDIYLAWFAAAGLIRSISMSAEAD